MQIRFVLAGLGNVGKRLLELLERKEQVLRERFGLEFVIAAAVDSSGGQIFATPPAPRELAALKAAGKKLKEVAATMGPLELTRTVDANLLVELTPVNLKTGEPGLGLTRAALGRQMNVVTANKGPLVLAFQELSELARTQGVKL